MKGDEHPLVKAMQHKKGMDMPDMPPMPEAAPTVEIHIPGAKAGDAVTLNGVVAEVKDDGTAVVEVKGPAPEQTPNPMPTPPIVKMDTAPAP